MLSKPNLKCSSGKITLRDKALHQMIGRSEIVLYMELCSQEMFLDLVQK